MLAVLNLNRPDTETVETCIQQIRSIEEETGVDIVGIINNTHMLRETTTEDILLGYEECRKVGEKLEIPVVYNTCVRELLPELLADAKAKGIDTKVLDIPNGVDYDGSDGCDGGGSDGDDGCAGDGRNVNEHGDRCGTMYIYPITLQMRPSWLDQKI